jgi:hypothetical protein
MREEREWGLRSHVGVILSICSVDTIGQIWGQSFDPFERFGAVVYDVFHAKADVTRGIFAARVQ